MKDDKVYKKIICVCKTKENTCLGKPHYVTAAGVTTIFCCVNGFNKAVEDYKAHVAKIENQKTNN